MNFLAHLYLSGESVPLQIGNFIADSVKGKQIDQFDESIRQGIMMHREIDAFTDNHFVVAQSKDRLRSAYRHYSGVIVDIFYDHFLAVSWAEYSATPLPDYAQSIYKTMNENLNLLPERVKQMLPYMIKQDWLTNYAHIDGIQQVLNGMSRRTNFDSKMNESTRELKAFYPAFATEFAAFFPELVNHVKRFKD